MSEHTHPLSDAGLATAFNLGPIILSITRLADGRFVEINERFLSATGYTRDEVLGRTPLELGLWVEPERRADGLRRLTHGQPVREVEADFRMKNGEVRTCLMSAELIELNGELCALTALTDIVERKRAEAVLERYHLLSERTRAIILFLRPDGRIADANAAAVAAYGYDRATLLGKTLRDLRAEETWPPLAAQMLEAESGGVMFTTTHRRCDGSHFPVEVSSIGADVGGEHLLLSIIRDITDRQQAEQERAELLAREHAARIAAEDAVGRVAQLQALTAALARALTPLEVAEISMDHALMALGAQQGQLALIGASGDRLDLVAPAAAGQIALDSADPLAQAARTHALVVAGAGEQGQHICVAVPLIIEDQTVGALALRFGAQRVIGDSEYGLLWALALQCAQALQRTHLYEAERRARSAAEAAVQVRDTFLSTAAHELKTPLTVLLGNSQLLDRRLTAAGTLSERERRLLRVVGEQAMRLNQLITTMLDISRLEARQLTISRAPFDLGGLTRRVVDELRAMLTRHTLTYQAPDEALMIDGDEMRLEQVLHNLLGNAAKYSPEGGAITMAVERRQGMICVSVSDHGIGIPAQNLASLFQRFYRAENVDTHQISGMGIGLYVVRAIVELHGGSVEVASAEGSGATFTVSLPALPA
jgi:PAS domain S-box-containing protein